MIGFDSISSLCGKIKRKFVQFQDGIYSKKFNKKVFPKEIAKKCPVWLSHKTRVEGCFYNCIEIKSDDIEKYMIKIGNDNCTFGLNSTGTSFLRVDKNAKIIFEGKAELTMGVSIRLFKNAILRIGEGFYANANCSFSSNKEISIGKDVLFGWNVNIRDSDGHNIYDANTKEVINMDQEVVIEDHVWIASMATVMKGATISRDSIVGYGSIVTKKFAEGKCILAGVPAKIVKRDIEWEN